jgi:hypothetical protein
MAATIPMVRIRQLIGMLDAESLEESIIQSWKCTIDVLGKSVGLFHPLLFEFASNSSVMSMNQIFLDAERRLRGLFDSWKKHQAFSPGCSACQD